MATIFDSVKLANVKTSTFDLSHDVKLSLNMGELVPILCMETVPGDSFNISAESLLRFAPLVSPVMHRMDVTMHYFYVPNRIIWPNWENFITNTKVAGVLPAFPTTQIYMSGVGNVLHSRLADYLGIPLAVGAGQSVNETVSALPFAAYQKIYNEYYRDQNLIPSVIDTLTDGDNTSSFAAITALRTRAWEHDYFTSALPFAQKGDSVSIPLGDVTLKDPLTLGNIPQIEDGTGGPLTGALASDGSGLLTSGGTFGFIDPNGSLEVSPTTVNDLRNAFSLQKWLEKMARGGSRYIEVIKSHFNVRSSDKRLQRPEYITGTKSPVVISEVLNTTGTEDAPQGQMAGHGIAVSSGKNGSFFCEEHGYIIGIMSVMPKPAYFQGVPKHFIKTDPTHYAWPDFANLGEQPVEARELYGYTINGDDTFGYVPRYAEYKYEPSRVAGDFRTTLDFWHGARKFASMPALNQTFIEMDSEAVDRIFAVTDPAVQKLLCHVYNKVTARRPLPKFGTPSF